MRTITVIIGNSDNKLSQIEWHGFVSRVEMIIRNRADAIHFFGGPENWSLYQNVAFVFACHDDGIDNIRDVLQAERLHWRQDSIAYIEGETELL